MDGAPRRWATVGDTIAGNDALHRASMAQGSASLRDRVLRLLADRQAKFTEQVATHDAARTDIRRGVGREEVMRRHDLSATAYSQLASQVSAGA